MSHSEQLVFAADDYIVRARGVRRVFGTRAVLDGVDLELRQGDVVALVGPSGLARPPCCASWPDWTPPTMARS